MFIIEMDFYVNLLKVISTKTELEYSFLYHLF